MALHCSVSGCSCSAFQSPPWGGRICGSCQHKHTGSIVIQAQSEPKLSQSGGIVRSDSFSRATASSPVDPRMFDWCTSVGLPELAPLLTERKYNRPQDLAALDDVSLKKLCSELHFSSPHSSSQFENVVQIFKMKLEVREIAAAEKARRLRVEFHELEEMKLLYEAEHMLKENKAQLHFMHELNEKLKAKLVAIETDRFKSIIEHTIATPAKPVSQIVSEIQQIDMGAIPHVNEQKVKESLTLLTEALELEGIELDLTSTDYSDLQHLHSLSNVELTKMEISYDRSPIDDSSPDEVLKSPQKSDQLKEAIQNIIALELDIPVEVVFVTNLRKGSIKFDVIIGNVLFLQQQKKADVDNAIKFMDLKNRVCGILESHFGNGKPKSIAVAPFKKPLKLKICARDFDNRYDFNFPNATGDKQMRGGIVYLQPTNQWVRRAFRVLDLYPDNDWLRMDGGPGEWAIGFHGTYSSGENGLSAIATTRFFGVGSAHACQAYVSQAPFTIGQAYGGAAERAIYFTKDIEHCYKLMVTRDADTYEIAFQCRINPNFFYDSNPGLPGNYCVVRGPENIRPYGICFKKVK